MSDLRTMFDVLRRLRDALSREDGQAMTEYALITFLSIVAVVAGWNLLPQMIRGWQVYLDGFYLIINLPVP